MCSSSEDARIMNTANKLLHPHLLTLLAALLLGACSTAPVQQGETVIEPAFSTERVLGGYQQPEALGEEVEEEEVTYLSDEVYDPWEGFNRTMYRFNYRFDKYVFLPAVSAYQTVTPDFMEQGIHNFFRNLQDITTLINSILQLSPEKTLNTTTRLVINSTAGLFGFINVANDVPRSDEDFGQTLGYWGLDTGPYLVLPILGPSNVRDGVGTGVDWLAYNGIRRRTTDMETWQEWTMDILKALDLRAHTAFRYYETGSPFEYDWVRLLYTTKRKLDIER
jgi:phospholipid-binding lipoprotein MlaA